MSLALLEDTAAKKLVLCRDAQSGLRAIIAIHSTKLGPAAGGLRMKPYADEAEAVRDALRLAQAMTYKYAASDIPMGGAKAVIIGEPRRDKSYELLRSFGRFVQEQGGEYSAGEDVGTDGHDMEVLSEETEWLVSLPESAGGPGDVSRTTARGVWQAIRACVAHVDGESSLAGKTVSVQGVGQVGAKLARLLADSGAHLVLADIDQGRAERLSRELDARVESPESIHQVEADVFAPCALGDAINSGNVGEVRAPIVAGAANNVFASNAVADSLQGRGVIYAVDYIANAGGIVYDDVMRRRPRPDGFDHQLAMRRVDAIFDRTRAILADATEQSSSIWHAAQQLAERRLLAAS